MTPSTIKINSHAGLAKYYEKRCTTLDARIKELEEKLNLINVLAITQPEPQSKFIGQLIEIAKN